MYPMDSKFFEIFVEMYCFSTWGHDEMKISHLTGLHKEPLYKTNDTFFN